MEDLISRQEAIDMLKTKVFHELTDEFYGTMQVLDELPSAISENKVNLCDSCNFTYPDCPSTNDDVIFCNDNICCCNKYKAVDMNVIIHKLNAMDRYVSEELRLCDTDKKFPGNEVFIVDDVYEGLVD